MRISLLTLGCKVNQYESRALEEALEDRGHLLVPFGQPADAIVLNSCTVTHRSDRDARAIVRRARRLNPRARIVVTGCYAQVDPDALRRIGADAVVGTGERVSVPDVVEEGSNGVFVGPLDDLRQLRLEPVTRFGRKTRAFLKVQDGCAACCAYCIVPRARGPSRSLPIEDVCAGLSRFREEAYREVVLTGVHLGHWGRDLDPPHPFSVLLDAAEASGIARIRLSSLEPMEVTEGVVERLAASQSLCPHLHVPLQSGSDRILTAMGRPYTARVFRRQIEAALGAVPALCLGFDVMVGFPGEDAEAFEETRALLEELPFAYLHVFPFSPRRGTPAWDLPARPPDSVVKERSRILRDLSREKRRDFSAAQLGSTHLCLAEGAPRKGWLTARSRNYIPVCAPWKGAPPADEIPILLDRLEGERVIGSLQTTTSTGG